MRREKGITLSSLVIYIIVMLLVIGIMSSISIVFYQNNRQLSADTEDMVEYNRFNQYFVAEIKAANNQVDQIGENGQYILFTSGNSFSLKNNHIYFNEIEIAKNIKTVKFDYYTDEKNEQHKDIINVRVELEHYQKQMNYKIEEIN